MAERAPRRVAFTHISRVLWAGGYNYQLNLFGALASHRPGEITPVLFAGTDAPAAELAPFRTTPGVEVVQSPAFDRGSAGLMAALATGIDGKALNAFNASHVGVVFENARFFGWRLPLPVVAWFPDLQHLRLPTVFSPAARWRRELGFRVQMASGRDILLSSQSALSDFRTLYPRATNPVSVARFATKPSPDLLAADAVSVLRQYDLPETFFYLPNQFWVHKNHRLVVKALAILKQRGAKIVVAASGSKQDSRNPNYFSEIQAEIADCGIAANFRYLGLIPLSHVYALLRTCRALINPSSFEGWSTTVEEAKSFGVPMILSDIAVHREQAATQADYFGIDDAAALADHLARASASPGPLAARDLLPGLDKRVAAFATDFAAAVERAESGFRG